MRVINAVNVNDAYRQAFFTMESEGLSDESRNGEVVVPPFPVMTIYAHPTERVLLSKSRDANPFFHLFESLWMLSGSNDARWLDRFVGDFSSRFAEDDGRQWGAYGHRWRQHFGFDQLDSVIHRLRHDHNDRRVVIQMWDAGMDLFDPEEIDEETGKPFVEPRDVPCNTQIYPRIVEGRLDITVMCRSNDVVWGAYGANAVHFSVLQEYLAGRIRVPVGKMYQFSNNWHLYRTVAARFEPERHRAYPGTMPIGTDWDHWDSDLSVFMAEVGPSRVYRNAWFSEVADVMLGVHAMWKGGDKIGAALEATRIAAPDWRTAVLEWMDRRVNK